jgi:hypothetical protein
MDKQIKKVNGRLRKNGQTDLFTALFSGKADREIIMQFCNTLADKIDEIIEVINKQDKENG